MSDLAAAEKRLRIAFAAGAVTDALAIIPMLSPTVAELASGVTPSPFNSVIAAGYSASLMLGWTLLLLWAYRRPVERRFVAVLTVIVIVGLVCAEILAVMAGAMSFARTVPTWVLQAVLIGLFARAYWASSATVGNH
jgi:hypothetical protein